MKVTNVAQKSLFLVSLALASLSAAAKWTTQSPATNPADFVLVSGLLAVPWFVILAVSVHKYGRAGCLVLVGAPFVLYWPTMLVLAVFGCVVSDAACT